MSFQKPELIMNTSAENGYKKAYFTFQQAAVLGFLAGAFIAIGYLLAIRVTANLPDTWGSLGSLIGASVFPIGLILTLLAGGELLTGNMMSLPMAYLYTKINLGQVLKNWGIILIANFCGAISVAYFFGHVVGLTEHGAYLDATVAIAEGKLHYTFLQAFISAIGCNWLVALAVWLSYGTDDLMGKIIGIWFPTMAFVAIGFQHVVANMFVIPAAIFAGAITWMEYLQNFVPVLLGNTVGGSIFVAAAYWFAYNQKQEKEVKEKATIKVHAPLLKRSH